MKKIIILVGLLLVMAHTVFAEQRDIFLDFHRTGNTEKNSGVNRSLMRLPIEVVYDSDTHIIKVTGNESLEAEVFLYNANGTLENYSPTVNTDFTVLTPGTYIIQVQGDGWYAEGEIAI